MGTSQSKPSAKRGKPLVPAWADGDPPAPGPTPPVAPPFPPVGPSPIPTPAPVATPPAEKFASRRLVGFRRALREFYRTGDQNEAKRALGSFARGSMGGNGAAAARVGRAARVGGAVFSSMFGGEAPSAPPVGQLDIRILAGLPTNEAIDLIIDNFCPPGILDEEAIRAAMHEALAEVLNGLDAFDPGAIDANAAERAVCAFVTELVFTNMIAEQGPADPKVPPIQVIQRENELREVIRAVVDAKAVLIVRATGARMTAQVLEQAIRVVSSEVAQEMRRW